MKRCAAVLAVLACSGPTFAADDSPTSYGLFGPLHLTRPAAASDRTVLLLSDRDGWSARAQALASGFAAQGALVVGVDLPAYLKRMLAIGDACSYPAGHFEELAHWIERHEGRADYVNPLVVGDGSGASFAYAMTTQAPSGTFEGLLTLGWDGHLRLPKPICAGDAGAMTLADGHGAFRIVPAPREALPWWPRPFAPGASSDGLLAGLDQVWRGIALAWPMLAPRPLEADLAATYAGIRARDAAVKAALPDGLADLPLTEIAPTKIAPTKIAPTDPDTGRIAIMLTGDGGWAGLDKGVAEALAAHGVRVVGFSTLKFFWNRRTPDEAAQALARIVEHYGARAPQARFVVIGYSFGASLAPILINRLPPTLLARVDGGVMISPDPDAVFEIKVGDWFGGAHHDGSLPVQPEIARSVVPIVCVHGAQENDSFCPGDHDAPLRTLSLPGGHHYNGDYAALGALIVANLPRRGS